MSNSTTHIALVCPGGPITHALADKVGQIAADHVGDRLKLHFHRQCFVKQGHFAGDDAARSAAFLEVANDPAVDGVWFARGGYGACRLDENLYGQLTGAASDKIYLGYSDNGVILARLWGLGFARLAHGPIAADLQRDKGAAAIRRAIDFLTGDHAPDDVIAATALKEKSLAFNITVLASIAGADWMPDLKGHVVMLEDVGEYLYRIDRSMSAIVGSGKLSGAAGVRLGRISAVPENDRPFGQDEEQIARYWCERAGVPYLGRADIGHDADNKIVPFAPVSAGN